MVSFWIRTFYATRTLKCTIKRVIFTNANFRETMVLLLQVHDLPINLSFL